eukprot:NODE_19654_length_833_cov_7.239377.p2 GENE.NODE_19654_length_833_cov_7.239377~~NODE_19654_length_833_cov_7.239377.p2  ORF type:complete len:149 (+),score=32.99 NODE_19654_length_833_cov_7.239377:81-527(+)
MAHATSNVLDDLRRALETRDEELYLDAWQRAEEKNISSEEITDGIEPVMSADQKRCMKWIDALFRSTKTFSLQGLREQATDWEKECHFTNHAIAHGLEVGWKLLPHLPNNEAWADNNPKVNVEIFGGDGFQMKLSGLTSRTEWNPDLS